MSAAPPTLHTFIVHAQDKEGAFPRRLEARESHIAAAQKYIKNGFIKVGGVMLSPESIDSADKTIVGSAFICQAESIAEVKKMVESDIYYTSGVWNPEKVVILPFMAATPLP